MGWLTWQKGWGEGGRKVRRKEGRKEKEGGREGGERRAPIDSLGRKGKNYPRVGNFM